MNHYYYMIDVEVDHNTWPSGHTPPQNFPYGTNKYPINLNEILLLIGILTTPTQGATLSLAAQWAQVRYLHAVTPANKTSDNILRLNQSWLDVDPHQKTLLSDDFGMGISCSWLFEELEIVGFCDGYHFVNSIYKNVPGAIVNKTNKGNRGPTKSPDFIAYDKNNKYHVIECKGTQTSKNYRDKQLDQGRNQKQVVKFSQNNAGEQLAAGIFIGNENRAETTNLKIIDPTHDPYILIENNQVKYAFDIIYRSMAAKALFWSGFAELARKIALPRGIDQHKQIDMTLLDNEIQSIKSISNTNLQRSISMDLVHTINIGNIEARKTTVTYDTKTDFLKFAADIATKDILLTNGNSYLGSKFGTFASRGSGPKGTSFSYEFSKASVHTLEFS